MDVVTRSVIQALHYDYVNVGCQMFSLGITLRQVLAKVVGEAPRAL